MAQIASVAILNPTFLHQKHTDPPRHPPNVTLDLPLLGMDASTITDLARAAPAEDSWSGRIILGLSQGEIWTRYYVSSVGKKATMRTHVETKMYLGTVVVKKEVTFRGSAREESRFSTSFLFPHLSQNDIYRLCLVLLRTKDLFALFSVSIT